MRKPCRENTGTYTKTLRERVEYMCVLFVFAQWTLLFNLSFVHDGKDRKFLQEKAVEATKQKEEKRKNPKPEG
jgi:hypothetical protein